MDVNGELSIEEALKYAALKDDCPLGLVQKVIKTLSEEVTNLHSKKDHTTP